MVIDWILVSGSIVVSLYLLFVLKNNRWLEYKKNKKALILYLSLLMINIFYSYFVYLANIDKECKLFVPDTRLEEGLLWKCASCVYSTCLFIIPFDYLIIYLHDTCDLFQSLSKLDDFTTVSIFQRKNEKRVKFVVAEEYVNVDESQKDEKKKADDVRRGLYN